MVWHLTTPFSTHPLSRFADDPFASLQHALEQSLGQAGSLSPSFAGATALRLDVKEDDKAFYVSADLPGMNEKEVEVTFEDGLLTLRGEKKIERDEKGDTWHVIERSSGSFARQVSLPSNVDDSKIEAKFEKGVLTVTLPKMPEEKAKSRKIEVKGN